MAKKGIAIKTWAAQSAGPPVVARLPPERVPWARTTLRIRPEHLKALRLAAIERSASGAMVELSEVLREVLDAWLAKR